MLLFPHTCVHTCTLIVQLVKRSTSSTVVALVEWVTSILCYETSFLSYNIYVILSFLSYYCILSSIILSFIMKLNVRCFICWLYNCCYERLYSVHTCTGSVSILIDCVFTCHLPARVISRSLTCSPACLAGLMWRGIRIARSYWLMLYALFFWPIECSFCRTRESCAQIFVVIERRVYYCWWES